MSCFGKKGTIPIKGKFSALVSDAVFAVDIKICCLNAKASAKSIGFTKIIVAIAWKSKRQIFGINNAVI